MTLCVWVALVGCSSDDEVSRAKCEKLRDHLVDLRLAGVTQVTTTSGSATQVPGVDVAAHRAAMKHALGESFLSSCQKTQNADQIKCALAANDTEIALACSKSASK